MVISENIVIVSLLFILVTFQLGVDFHILLAWIGPIDPCEQNKERIYGLAQIEQNS